MRLELGCEESPLVNLSQRVPFDLLKSAPASTKTHFTERCLDSALLPSSSFAASSSSLGPAMKGHRKIWLGISKFQIKLRSPQIFS